MRWPFTRKRNRPTEAFSIGGVEFLGSQDGANETALKDALSSLFAEERSVARAYLARVRYDGTLPINVALCLRRAGDSHEKLVEAIRTVFAARFATDAHLDILFIEPEQEAALDDVCPPFFPPSA